MVPNFCSADGSRVRYTITLFNFKISCFYFIYVIFIRFSGYPVTRLFGYSIIRLPGYLIFRLPGYPVTLSSGYSVTRYPSIRYPGFLPLNAGRTGVYVQSIILDII